ncbi:Aste57867_24298 [Aphanomyces stellatus]|uniref:beta-N-acetylhexosaminidase n=1 Tax=Aphanomyces stellatus TaxID=120398 RepID=A0A485LUE9_9STRA|nr:hypothetical protein As57867_024223 [Aphanomyces stellatus]VFU00938.1 Aste57867_24298 [Aphanomyces stellatus]
MRSCGIWITAVVAVSSVTGLAIPPKRYQCQNGVCTQTPLSITSSSGSSLRICQLTCGDGSLWPKPTQQMKLGSTVQAVNVASIPHSISFGDGASAPSALVVAMQGVFLDLVQSKATECTLTSVEDTPLSISATIKTSKETLSMETDESYSLTIDLTKTSTPIAITAASLFGYRHALMTLSQLVEYDDISHSMYIVASAVIRDAPAFAHRGLALDTSRNFYSVPALKRVLDGMGATKLNTFHWHMTDTHSFSVEIIGEPRLTQYGAYSARQVYTQAEVRALVRYGKARGIRIVPELDAPAHVGAGWTWGPEANLGDLVVCYDHDPWMEACVEPPCGQLNPRNPNIFPILTTIYTEFNALFESDVFHMGGDEVHVGCWNSSALVTAGMKSRQKRDFLDLWAAFQQQVLDSLHEMAPTKKAMLWSSDLTNVATIDKYLDPSDYIIQIWDATTVEGEPTKIAAQLAKKGFHVVLSNYDKWYLDCGGGNWLSNGTSWCDPYKSWQHIYDVDLFQDMPSRMTKYVLGGEVALWAEMADEYAAEVKLWPRAAAAAERLWSNPTTTTWKEAVPRLLTQRRRIVEMGIHADALQPQWCMDNPTRCTLL